MPWGEHLELSQIDLSVDTPETGHWEGSFDAKAITGALKSDGYERSRRDGVDVWTDSGKSGMAFRVSEDEISYSSTKGSDPLSAVTPEEGASLADNKDYRRAAECLGDVYRADFSPLTSSDSARLAALGQRATSAGKNTVEKGGQPFVRAVVPDTDSQRAGRLIVGDEELWLTVADL
ncbi:hypothetical protein ACFRK5_08925 [Streptomyces niveus]|uniref:hypothetical protein n=1 Tax=Streptomyces niveus TaxID=193462 RepID=UPI003691AF11